MADLFKLQGIVDVSTGRSDAALKRVDSAARSTEQSLGKLDNAAKRAGGAVSSTSGHFDRAAGSAGRLSSAIQSLASKMGSLHGAGAGSGGMFSGLTNIAGGNLLSGAIQSAISGVTGALKDGFQAGIEYNSMLEKARISFNTLLGSSTKAEEHLKSLQRFAETTPFEFPDLIKASQRMQAMGFAADKVIPSLRNIGDAVGAIGGGKEELNGIVLALSQMMTKGKVTAQEMNQLAERGVPAWDLLSKAIGKTQAETMALSEAGRLNGSRAVEGIIAMMGERFGGQMDKVAQTLEGRQSNLNDILNRRLGQATEGNFEQLKQAYAKATEGLGTTAADAFVKNANEGLSKIGAQIVPLMDKVASGEFFAGAAQSIGNLTAAGTSAGGALQSARQGDAMGAIKGVWGAIDKLDQAAGRKADEAPLGIIKGGFLDKAITGIKSGLEKAGLIGGEEGKKAGEAIGTGIKTGTEGVLQIKSPSKVFEGIGADVVQGFINGVDQNIDRSTEGIKKWAKAIEKAGGEEFLKAVEAMSKRLNLDPNKVMNVMAFESKLNPAAKNPGSTATGLIQFMKDTAEDLGTTVGKLKDMNAIEQLKYVEAYLKQFGKLANTQEALYTAVLAGRSVSDPGSVLFKKGSVTNRAYLANSGLDADKSGVITAGEATAKVLEQGFTRPAAEAFTLFNSASTMLYAAAQKLTAIVAPGAPGLKAIQQAGPIQGGEIVTQVFGSLGTVSSDMAELPKELNTLSTETKLAKAALAPAGDAMAKTGSQAGMFADAIKEAEKKTKEAVDNFAQLKDGFANGFDGLLGAIQEGGGKIQDALLDFGRDFFRGLQNSIFSSISGGKANSPGQFLSQTLFGGLGAGSGGGAGSFLTGGFAGGNPAAAILGGGGTGGGGGLGGILGKIPGLGGLFGKSGGLGNLPIRAGGGGDPTFAGGIGVSQAAGGGGMLAGLGATGLLAGGGLLGSLAGKSPLGKLMGSVGGTLLGGFAAGSGLFGGAMAGALPALFSNPITAIIGAGLIGSALLSRFLGGGIEKSLKKLTQGEYGIKIDDGTAKALRSIGESKFGKQFKGKQIETIRLPESRDLLAEYASATGQKGNSKLFTTAEFSDPYSNANLMKRAMGGPVSAGMPYLVGERRPEVFVPNQSGRIVPSVGEYGSGNSSEMANAIKDLRRAVMHLQSMPPDTVVSMARSSTVAKQMEREFRRRGDSSIAVRDLNQKR